MTVRRARSLALTGLLTVAALLVGQAAAVAGTPPSLDGSVQGTVTAGSTITIRITALQEGGWSNLNELQAILLLKSVILDQIFYDPDHSQLSVGSSLPVPVGSNVTASGTFFSVSGRDVSVATGGDRLSIVIRAKVISAVPAGAVFSLGAVDDFHDPVTRISRPVTVPPPPSRGFPWGALALAVVIALFAGGFVGNLFASNRLARPKLSVYAIIEQRISEGRAVA